MSAPVGTRILGAGKLTGKLTPTVNFGSMLAVTRREFADYSTSGVKGRQELEPLTYYGVLRGLKEFKDRQDPELSSDKVVDLITQIVPWAAARGEPVISQKLAEQFLTDRTHGPGGAREPPSGQGIGRSFQPCPEWRPTLYSPCPAL